MLMVIGAAAPSKKEISPPRERRRDSEGDGVSRASPLLAPVAVMMAIAGLLDDGVLLADGGQLAKHVARGGGSLSAADGYAGDSASDGSEGEKSLHFSSFVFPSTAAFFVVRSATPVPDPPED